MGNNDLPIIRTFIRLGFTRTEFLETIKRAVNNRVNWLKVSYVEPVNDKILECFPEISWSNTNQSHQLDKMQVNLYSSTSKMEKKTCKVEFISDPMFSLKEWFNLMEGRYVSRVIDSWGVYFHCWYGVKWDNLWGYGTVTKLRTSHKFDSEQQLMKLPIKDVNKQEIRDEILTSLGAGNLHRVKIISGKKIQIRFISVDPIKETLVSSSRRR